MTIKSTILALLLSATATAAAAPRPLESRDVQPISGAAHVLAQITSGKVTPGHGLMEQTIRDEARDCSQRVENLIARDYPPATPLPNTDTTLGEADAKICKALAKAADGWDKRSDESYAAQRDALLEPYRKAGVAGDKLKLVRDLGDQLIAPGQAEATPANVAKASVLFSLRHDGDRQWTIVRYAFKGNTQIRVTEKGYADQPGPDQFR